MQIKWKAKQEEQKGEKTRLLIKRRGRERGSCQSRGLSEQKILREMGRYGGKTTEGKGGGQGTWLSGEGKIRMPDPWSLSISYVAKEQSQVSCSLFCCSGGSAIMGWEKALSCPILVMERESVERRDVVQSQWQKNNLGRGWSEWSSDIVKICLLFCQW